MTNFIELTFISSDGNEIKRLINISRIREVYIDRDGDTRVHIGDYLSHDTVKESYDEVKNRLNSI